jgi:hypothetical protein
MLLVWRMTYPLHSEHILKMRSNVKPLVPGQNPLFSAMLARVATATEVMIEAGTVETLDLVVTMSIHTVMPAVGVIAIEIRTINNTAIAIHMTIVMVVTTVVILVITAVIAIVETPVMLVVQTLAAPLATIAMLVTTETTGTVTREIRATATVVTGTITAQTPAWGLVLAPVVLVMMAADAIMGIAAETVVVDPVMMAVVRGIVTSGIVMVGTGGIIAGVIEAATAGEGTVVVNVDKCSGLLQ